MSRMTPERQRELYACVLELVTDHGYEKLTMDQVAAASRSSKATLYRQWGSKAVLVASAIKQIGPPSVTLKDTGSLRGDLRAWARTIVATPDLERELVVSVLHACKSDRELRDALRDLIVTGTRVEFDTLLARAARRGEIEADAPGLGFVPVALAGPLILGEIIDDREIDATYLYEYIDAVVLPSLRVR